MYLLIEQPGLTFVYNNKEYTSPIEFEFDKHNLPNLLMQLRDADIEQFTISPNSKKRHSSRVVQNIVKKEKHVEKNIDKDQLLYLLMKVSDKLNSIEQNIQNQKSSVTYVTNNEVIQQSQNKSESSDLFIPEIDVQGMEVDFASNIKSEKNESNQEDSADFLRKLLGDKTNE